MTELIKYDYKDLYGKRLDRVPGIYRPDTSGVRESIDRQIRQYIQDIVTTSSAREVELLLAESSELENKAWQLGIETAKSRSQARKLIGKQ